VTNTHIHANKSDDFALIRQRLTDRLLQQPIDPSKLLVVSQTLRPDGTWPEIDYQNRNGGSWEPFEHLAHMRDLAILFRSDGGTAELAESVRRALSAWVGCDPQSDNWWYNHNGTPCEVGTVLLLMRDAFLPEEVPGALEIVRRARVEAGRNKECLIGLMAAVLAEDEAGAETALSSIWSGVEVGIGEGIQADASYHFHGPQLYSGGYGRGFAMNTAWLMATAAGTRFAAPTEKVEVFTRYVLDGSQWMIRGGAFEVTARGRETSRPEWDMRPDFAEVCRNMLTVGAPREAEWKAFLSRLENGSHLPATISPLEGVRHFWRSDLLIRQSERYFGSVKMNSVRICGTESGNGEGLTNYYLLFGCNLLMQRGDEYRNIYPVWDWHRLPGATCTATDRVLPSIEFGTGSEGTTRFVGGVTDGSVGLSAWVLERDGVYAHKASALLENGIVAVGAGIRGPEGEMLQTGVNQCWLSGDVWIKDTAGTRKLSDGGMYDNIEWVWHDGVGYCFKPGQFVVVRVGPQDGGWDRIMELSNALEYRETLPRDILSKPVFSLWIEHGRSVRNGSYQYAIFPGVNLEEMPCVASDSTVVVEANSADVQAVRDKVSGRTLCAFYRSGSASNVTVNQPCLVIGQEIRNGAHVTVSNPENEGLTVNVKYGRHAGIVRLPEGLLAGSSVTQELA